MLKYRMLTKIFRSKRKQAPGGWRKFCIEDLHGFFILVRFYYGDQIEEDWVGGVYCHMGEKINSCTVLLGKPERKKSFGIAWSK